ncbi:aldolase/citrate lyase family protein [Roseibacterium sp. SDUM158016]|uniref:aldolase/citrate lyase family protein n=1 Tax=Roseicyclus sediminis TaxID=2980997 RepID=UPI0021D1218A|nr:aldolase/citrate lyase family protein [Roseibacterium sp. SDUM158016]MCU4652062.1 aldolase/citrate lyase family protein [Roseibacterium sp. SDUM158016]
MADLKSRLYGDAPLIAVNPGGLAVSVADALAGQDDLAIFIDCERTPVTVSEAAIMARAARANGLFSILRTESADAAIVTRYLDCRIDAIVLPQMESSAQCAAVHAVLETHAATAKRTTFIAQIESAAGHAALDEIARTPGIDAILIGPNDLAASMGLPGQPQHPDVVAAVDDISARVRGHGLAFGLPVKAATASDWAHRGARLFYTVLGQFLGDGLRQLREARA